MVDPARLPAQPRGGPVGARRRARGSEVIEARLNAVRSIVTKLVISGTAAVTSTVLIQPPICNPVFTVLTNCDTVNRRRKMQFSERY
jgi:hypothetical protein